MRVHARDADGSTVHDGVNEPMGRYNSMMAITGQYVSDQTDHGKSILNVGCTRARQQTYQKHLVSEIHRQEKKR